MTTTRRAATLAKTAMATEATVAADGATTAEERSGCDGRRSEHGEETADQVFQM